MTRRDRTSGGQALVELALVLPLFVMLLFGIVALGLGVFYQQQLTNAAREAARFASVNSATAQCPTTSHLDPRPLPYGVDSVTGRNSTGLAPDSYYPCDTPAASWPKMTASARSLVFGLDPNAIQVTACWSGYVSSSQYDAAPPGAASSPTSWAQCTIDGQDLTTGVANIGCRDGMSAATVDTGSDISESPGSRVANTVTTYTCYVWSPPLAGFLLIPSQVTLRAIITEPIQRQQ